MGPPTGRRPRLPLWTWLVLSHLLAFALPVAAFLGTGAFAMDLQRQTRKSLENQAVLLELLIRAELRQAREHDPQAGVAALADQLDPALDEFAQSTFAGVRVVDLDGTVVASTGPMLGADLSGRPEVREALAGRAGWINRKSPPVAPGRGQPSAVPAEGERLYVATPIQLGPEPDAPVVGALLLSRSPRGTWQVLRNMGPRLDVGISASLVVMLGLVASMGWGFSRTIRRLSRATDRLAAGQGPDTPRDPDLGRALGSRIDEVAALAEDFRAMSDRLRARLEYIAEFAGNVSHEFKTPIATLRGTLELLEDDPEMPATQRALFLTNALAELHRMQRLVDGLLALARADQRGQREPVDLGALATELAALHPGVQVQGAGATVQADRRQLEVALGNLVDNALEHGGAQVRVRLRPWVEADRCGVDVEDDGAGISEANQARVFDRFFTTARERGGTGLGLALVKAVAEAHGGGVALESRTGHTRFRLWLPLPTPGR
ncbi:ATP-binding protein [Myxococcota bacterium]|nr:ATP-binding protein [Myxococcota bacterium]